MVELADRTTELEIKMAKLWDILTEKTKKDVKISPFAKRRFLGKI
jgi:hypothetical protein